MKMVNYLLKIIKFIGYKMNSTYDFSEFENCPDWDFKLWPVKEDPSENVFHFLATMSCNTICFKLSLN